MLANPFIYLRLESFELPTYGFVVPLVCFKKSLMLVNWIPTRT
jgi:hypothetical protein